MVASEQRVEVFDPGGRLLERRTVALEFSLVPARDLVAMAGPVGLVATRLLGGWDDEPYDGGSSPVLIAIFETTGG